MIITEEMKHKIEKIAKIYGFQPQADVAIEEMAELTKELLKFRRANNSEDAAAVAKNIVEEMADVQIMLLQIDYLLREAAWIKDSEFYENIMKKLNRQLERINSKEDKE